MYYSCLSILKYIIMRLQPTSSFQIISKVFTFVEDDIIEVPLDFESQPSSPHIFRENWPNRQVDSLLSDLFSIVHTKPFGSIKKKD